MDGDPSKEDRIRLIGRLFINRSGRRSNLRSLLLIKCVQTCQNLSQICQNSRSEKSDIGQISRTTNNYQQSFTDYFTKPFSGISKSLKYVRGRSMSKFQFSECLATGLLMLTAHQESSPRLLAETTIPRVKLRDGWLAQ
jgi:hypothetical protein